MQLGWKTFTILYDDEESLIRLQDLMKMSTTFGYRVYVRRLPASGNYRLVIIKSFSSSFYLKR